ncbi:MAG: Uma2 family endonuclease [Polyangiales bacterium]
MSPAERRALIDALPAAMTEAELAPSEGDAHFDAKVEGRETLRTHFERVSRRIYVGAELTVYYPDEDRFAPVLCAVTDVDPHPREKWVVSDEGKGIEWILEVLVRGDRQKDLERNRARYARLRVPEYFVFDHRRNLLRGWRLPDRMIGIYHPIVPQQGVLRSEVLGLDLTLDGRKLRFRDGNAQLLAPQEIITWMEDHVTDLVNAVEEAEQRAEAEAKRAEAEAKRAEAEAKRAEAAERRVQELEAELRRARGE